MGIFHDTHTPHPTNSPTTGKLLQQDEVAAVPCFPSELWSKRSETNAKQALSAGNDRLRRKWGNVYRFEDRPLRWKATDQQTAITAGDEETARIDSFQSIQYS